MHLRYKRTQSKGETNAKILPNQCHIYKSIKQSVIMMAVYGSAVLIQAGRIVGVGVLVNGCSAVFIRQQFFDLPGVGLDSDGEFQVFLGN